MLKFILSIEKFFSRNNISHRFVGGVSFGGLLNKKTTWNIDIKKRTIALHNYNQLSKLRSDGTLKDIDIIILSKDKNVDPRLSTRGGLSRRNDETISIEHAIFYPKKLNPLSQFVTTIFVDEKNIPYLQFGSIVQPITWNSLEPWKVILGTTSFTVRNPIADYFAYQFRSPAGTKHKDKEKLLLLKQLADDVMRIGKKHAIDYGSNLFYGSWQAYTNMLQESKNIHIAAKRLFMKTYWNTIGEYLAHGKGFAKYVQQFSNKFTGSS